MEAGADGVRDYPYSLCSGGDDDHVSDHHEANAHEDRFERCDDDDLYDHARIGDVLAYPTTRRSPLGVEIVSGVTQSHDVDHHSHHYHF